MEKDIFFIAKFYMFYLTMLFLFAVVFWLIELMTGQTYEKINELMFILTFLGTLIFGWFMILDVKKE